MRYTFILFVRNRELHNKIKTIQIPLYFTTKLIRLTWNATRHLFKVGI